MYFLFLVDPVYNRIISVPECSDCHVWYFQGFCWGNCGGRWEADLQNKMLRLDQISAHMSKSFLICTSSIIRLSLSLQHWTFVRSGEIHPHFSPSIWGKRWGGWRAEIRFPTLSTRKSSFTEASVLQIIWEIWTDYMWETKKNHLTEVWTSNYQCNGWWNIQFKWCEIIFM